METQTVATDGKAPPPVPPATTQMSGATQAEFRLLALDNIRESPANPRKTFDAAREAELEASVRQKGVTVPIKVRPMVEAVAGGRAEIDRGYQIVYGARRLRAARAAGLKVIPALVQRMSDKEALEEAVIENLQRSDVHPLEEADGYHQLMAKHGYGAEDLAAKVGKSKAYIYARLKLRELGEAGRKAFLGGGLTTSVALLVARIPSAKLQAEATKALSLDHVSYRSAVEIVHRDYMLQLKNAPFDVADAGLLKSAGPCTTCPKRSGNQAELFADVKSPDVCTDPVCYELKRDALWKLTASKAQEAGQKVLSEQQAKRAFPYGQLAYDSEYVELAASDYRGGGKTFKEQLPKDAPAPVLARNPESGDVVELMRKEDFNKATGKKLRVPGKPTPRDDPKRGQERQAAADKERRARDKVNAAVMARLVAEVEKGAATAKVWRLMARPFVRDFGAHHVLARRGMGTLSNKAVEARIAKMSDRELRGLVFEFAISADEYAGGDGSSPWVTAACKAFGVDADKIAAELAPAPAKKKAAKAPAPKKAKKAGGAK